MKTLRCILPIAFAGAGPVLGAQAQAPSPSDLGSPTEARATFSTDYRGLVASALPRVSAESLAGQLRAVAKEGTAQLQVRDARAWAALFDLGPERAGDGRIDQIGEIVELERGAVLVRPEEGRLWVAVRQGESKPQPRAEFARLVPEIRRSHSSLAEKIGIPGNQVFFTDFRETLAQSSPRAGLPGARESAIESVGATTTLLRAVGGLLVDGSFVRIASVDARRFEMVDVRWPEIRLAPEVDPAKVLAPASLADRLAERVAASARKRPVNVLMAVVLRPLRAPHRTYFVPSLRIGVLPKSERLEDGYRTEAGEEIYVDLVPGLEERDVRELTPESMERKEGREKQ